MKKTISGFTIVELLLVIVIVGILAMISVVAYRGTQQRARNAKVAAGVDIYRKSIINYAAKTGSYPNSFGACLGANYPSNQCWTGPNGTFNVSAGFDTLLAPYLGNVKPELATNYLQVTATDQRLGAIYLYYSASDVRLVYYLEGQNQQCIPGATSTNEMQTTQCRFNFPAV